MGEEIFRKKSLDKVKSPENLDDYIRVTNPSIWLLLISVIVLLIGTCIWGIYGHVDSTVPSTVNVQNGKAVCFVSEENIDSVQKGMSVEYEDYEAVITKIGEKENKGYQCTLRAEALPSDGMYEGKVIIKRYKPMTFVMN